LIFLPKFLLIFFILYLERFCFLSLVGRRCCQLSSDHLPPSHRASPSSSPLAPPTALVAAPCASTQRLGVVWQRIGITHRCVAFTFGRHGPSPLPRARNDSSFPSLPPLPCFQLAVAGSPAPHPVLAAATMARKGKGFVFSFVR
jgi:hypothetical protein